jgi:hypothetical protein
MQLRVYENVACPPLLLTLNILLANTSDQVQEMDISSVVWLGVFENF